MKMGIDQDMKTLAQEMADSYEARVKRVATLRRETADLLKTLQAGRRSRASEVRKLLGGYRKERAEAAAVWRKLAVTMQKRRAEIATKGVVVEKAEKVKEAKPAEPAKRTKKPPPKGGVLPPPTFEDKLLSLLKEHRQGLRLVDIAEITGKSKAKLKEVLKSLRATGKVEKKNSQYFSKE